MVAVTFRVPGCNWLLPHNLEIQDARVALIIVDHDFKFAQPVVTNLDGSSSLLIDGQAIEILHETLSLHQFELDVPPTD
uniref:Uncharacterized protein n=1 Tax=Candidozyma auris TaxID=498019 RepID=A0A0L0NTY0_CANAR